MYYFMLYTANYANLCWGNLGKCTIIARCSHYSTSTGRLEAITMRLNERAGLGPLVTR